MGVAMGCQGNSRWRQHSPMSLHSLDATTIVCMNVCLWGEGGVEWLAGYLSILLEPLENGMNNSV